MSILLYVPVAVWKSLSHFFLHCHFFKRLFNPSGRLSKNWLTIKSHTDFTFYNDITLEGSPQTIADLFTRGVIAQACTHTCTKAFTSLINCTCKSNFACVWSRYMPLIMLILNRWLLLNVKLKLLILNRNQKGFLLSPVYKCLKVYLYIQEAKKTPQWRKPAMCKQGFFKTNLFKGPIICCITNKGKRKNSYKWMG